MREFKYFYVKSHDTDKILNNMKKAMEEYDMYIVQSEGNKYTFDRDAGYSRSFVINEPVNGWIAVHDEDEALTESLCHELSESISSFILCIGVFKDMLYYTVFENGRQSGQFMSTLDYYEYPINDDVIKKYEGDIEVFKTVLDDAGIMEASGVLAKSRAKSIKPEEAYYSLMVILGIMQREEEAPEEENQDQEEIQEDEPINPKEIFYVDFKDINVRTENLRGVLDAIERIAEDMGYKKVDDFTGSREKKGLFKKIFSSVTESRKLRFYVSPVSDGWVTFAGEIEVLLGEEPQKWLFVDISDKISGILGCTVLRLQADSEKWGIEVYRDGSLVYRYSSDMEYDDAAEGLTQTLGIDDDAAEVLIGKELHDAHDVDEIIKEFCSILKIDNYRMNIPMDYTEDEYYSNVINLLPDGNEFISLKFVQNK